MLNFEKARDIDAAVHGVVRIFRKKTWQPLPPIPVNAYNILISFLENHYKNPMVLQRVTQPRIEVRIKYCSFHYKWMSIFGNEELCSEEMVIIELLN